MKQFAIMIIMLLFSGSLAGCTSDETEEVQAFPVFSSVADNQEIYDNARMDGGAYIVVFSAEWCNSPCFTTMHAIWSAQAELPVLVMSTDPAENATGVTLAEWHESADAHDDDGDETGVTLTTYAFMKGHEAGKILGIDKPGSVVFVNADGEVTYLHEGRMDDSAEILQRWAVATA